MRTPLDYLVQTDNVKRSRFALEELKRRHQAAPGRSILVIQGLTGRGKTSWAEFQAVQDPLCEYLEAKSNWSPSWMLRDVAEALGMTRAHSTEENYRAVVELQRRRPRLLMLDEAERIVRSERLLETLRELHDEGLPLVLLGETGSWSNTTRTGVWSGISRKSPRFADRVGQVVEFGDIRAADIADAALHLNDLKLNGQENYLHQQAGGNFRRAAKILTELEAVCKANPGEINRARVDLAIKNLQLAEAREQRRSLRQAAAGGA